MATATTEQPSRTRRKHLHGEQNAAVSIDRLSDLPNSVLCHILSFLRTKASVQTSILGKRWRYLWAYLPNLYFVNDDQNAINRVLLLRKLQNVDTFRLTDEYNKYPIDDTWITFAVERNLQILDLCLRSQAVLPRCLFTCKTLVDLKLESCGVVPMGVTVYLPRLKKLHLLYVQYEADESLPHLLSGCPVLEELEIELNPGMVCCNISSPSIKRLVLNSIFEGSGCRADSLEINTPALEYLVISDYFNDHIKSEVLTSLIEANIDFEDDHGEQGSFLYSIFLLEFFDTLCNVKCLTLGISYCLEIVDRVLSGWTASFRNLTTLELSADCRVLSKFLESAHNLEILIFTEFYEKVRVWKEPPQQVPTRRLSHLRIVKLVNIRGEKHEFKLIKYLLRNAKVLERMEISYNRLISADAEIGILKKISLYQRGSTTCKVAFGDDCLF